MSAKHTPWRYVSADIHHGPYVTDSLGKTVCDCYFIRENQTLFVYQGQTADTNARLIAAAPDLLAALRIVVSQLEYVWHSIALEEEQIDALNLARAAIAKAEGRS